MEIDDPNSNISDLISPKLSINVLQLLKSSQMQHGLRHGDYTRYRKYCTARLRRLYKSLKFTYDRGKYTRKAITESTVIEVSNACLFVFVHTCLEVSSHVILYTAERAWSHAMEKRQLPDGPNARQRIYLIGAIHAFHVLWKIMVAKGTKKVEAIAGSAENVKDDLNGLDKTVSAVLGQQTIERNQLLVSIAKSKLTRCRDDKNEEVTKPEELVRLYDLLLQNTADLSDLVSSGRDRKPEELTFAEECQVKSLAFRAERCFYLARSYSLAGKISEAYALYCRARSLAENSLHKFQTHSKTGQILQLYRACNRIEAVKAPENLSKKISTISLSGTDKKRETRLLIPISLRCCDVLLWSGSGGKIPAGENLSESAVSESNVKAVPRIEPFPPAFQSIPRNPIVLDLADSCIDFPSIENRMKKDKKGFISRLWG
ncbi:hypothetical protein F3Y22_tig00110319pilonHSYRG00025 [Hibiscus syriacus]|uniref:Signal recognition particle subunit SRP68 n=1 Tax=Hibiscus syriacus TaxID=106335 RepID=A0A6A3B6G5_HIBSY|nr:hypothetical protein F3Y22_tig00110319pilonHSYRG00025 [Hibiscus syriacus]